MATVKYNNTLSIQQLTYLVNLLQFSDMSRTLRSYVSKQLFVPKAKLNIGKCAFSVAAPTIYNQLSITIKSFETIAMFRKNSKHICLKLLYHHNFSAVLCSNDDFCLSPLMIMPNDFVCYVSMHDF